MSAPVTPGTKMGERIAETDWCDGRGKGERVGICGDIERAVDGDAVRNETEGL